MRKLNRILPFFLLAFIIVSCGNKQVQPKKTVDTLVNYDSTFPAADGGINPYATVDVSPMDISYYPADYPKIKTANPSANPPLARVIYSRPHLQGRKLFPSVLKYGAHWRLGANEATEIQFYNDVDILGEKVKAGRYIIYCTPQPETWTIALNSNIDSWGLVPDPTKDIAHFTIPSTATRQRIEFFTIVFEKQGEVIDLLMAWDNIEARLPLKF